MDWSQGGKEACPGFQMHSLLCERRTRKAKICQTHTLLVEIPSGKKGGGQFAAEHGIEVDAKKRSIKSPLLLHAPKHIL